LKKPAHLISHSVLTQLMNKFAPRNFYERGLMITLQRVRLSSQSINC